MSSNPISNRVQKLEGAASATAKGLLRDNTIKVITAGHTAQWDHRTRELHVPAFSMRDDDDPALLDAWRGTLDHECGHAENTDMELVDATLEVWKVTYGEEAVARMFRLWNMFEDPRQEGVWSSTRPGSASNLARMHDWYVSKTPTAHDPAMTNSKGEPIGPWEALCQSVLRLKLGHLTFAECHPLVQSILVTCETEARAGWSAQSTGDALDATEAFWKKLLDEQEKQENDDQQDEQDDQQLDMPQPPGEGGDDDSDQQDGEQDADGPGDCDDDGEEGDNDADDAEGDNDDADEDGDEEADGSDSEGSEDDDGEDAEGSDGDGDDEEDADDGEGDNADDGEDGEDGEDDGPTAPMMDLGGQHSGDVDLGGGAAGEEPAQEIPFDMGDDGDEGETPGGNGFGAGNEKYKDPLADAMGGDFAELEAVGEMVASEVLADPSRRPYTVHPNTRRQDMVKTYSEKDRREGMKVLPGLRAAAKGASSILGNTLRDVVAATKQTLWVGALEDGEHLDMDALPGVALGLPDQAIFGDFFRQTDDDVFVVVVTDCSGSMGSSSPTKFCTTCKKASSAQGEKCQRRTWRGGRDVKCGGKLSFKVTSKAGYAAVLSMALHDALRLTEVPHAILGYNAYSADSAKVLDDNGDLVSYANPPVGHCKAMPKGYPLWSRYRTRTVMHEFVPAPGLGDNGAALPYITGGGWNSDGDSLREAALYAAEHASDKDRIVMIVACDGAPVGADDTSMNRPYLTQTVEEIAQAGIEVYGFGIGMRPDTFAQFYPDQPAVGGRAATGHVCLDRHAQGLGAAVLMRLCRIIGQSVGFSRSAGGR